MTAFTYTFSIGTYLFEGYVCDPYGCHDDAVRRVAARLSIEVREWRDKIAEMEVNRSQVMTNVKEDTGRWRGHAVIASVFCFTYNCVIRFIR